MNIYITTPCLIKDRNFLKADFLEDVTLVDYHDGCSACVESHTDQFFLYTVDGVDYYIPDIYAIEDDGTIVIDGTYPLDKFVERTSIPWPGKEPIKDYEKAYEEYMGIRLTDDPRVHKYNQDQANADDPGKNSPQQNTTS
jgi:hypothetical protein